jgi:myosin-5
MGTAAVFQRSPENGHNLNGDIRQTEMKPSTSTSEAITSAVSLTCIKLHNASKEFL